MTSNIGKLTLKISSLLPGCIIHKETDYYRKNIITPKQGETQKDCAILAASTDGALFWSYRASDKLCWVKNSDSGKREQEGVVSGNIECGEEEEDDKDEEEEANTGSDYYFLYHQGSGSGQEG